MRGASHARDFVTLYWTKQEFVCGNFKYFLSVPIIAYFVTIWPIPNHKVKQWIQCCLRAICLFRALTVTLQYVPLPFSWITHSCWGGQWPCLWRMCLCTIGEVCAVWFDTRRETMPELCLHVWLCCMHAAAYLRYDITHTRDFWMLSALLSRAVFTFACAQLTWSMVLVLFTFPDALRKFWTGSYISSHLIQAYLIIVFI